MGPISLEGEWLTSSQVAARLGVTPTYVHKLARDGRLPFQETPLGRLFSEESVDALKVARDSRRIVAVVADDDGEAE